MKLKVCGMRERLNIAEIAVIKPDFIGFIFYKGSKRYVGEQFDIRNLPDLPDDIKKVGVFVNSEVYEIVEKVEKLELDCVQLHGDESPEFCRVVKDKGFKIIKAFGVGKDFNFEKLAAYEEYCDFFLFDTKGDNFGGNGVAFDWSILSKYKGKKQYFLSGGVGLENIHQLKDIDTSKIYAIDVNSKVELAPGVKDSQKISLLAEKLKLVR